MRSSLGVAVAAVAFVAGCNNFLARHNPCGGIYPADGVAEIGSVETDGVVDIASPSETTHPFTSDPTAPSSEDCWTFITGLATEDGASTTTYQVTCGSVEVSLTIPDVRTLSQGAKVTLPSSVTSDGSECFAGSATLTIEQSVGAKAPAPTFVTRDFVRVGILELDSTTIADGGTSSRSCPSHVALHGRISLTASNYSQATTAGEDHCPSLPSK
jgi:hypothetical protein